MSKLSTREKEEEVEKVEEVDAVDEVEEVEEVDELVEMIDLIDLVDEVEAVDEVEEIKVIEEEKKKSKKKKKNKSKKKVETTEQTTTPWTDERLAAWRPLHEVSDRTIDQALEVMGTFLNLTVPQVIRHFQDDLVAFMGSEDVLKCNEGISDIALEIEMCKHPLFGKYLCGYRVSSDIYLLHNPVLNLMTRCSRQHHQDCEQTLRDLRLQATADKSVTRTYEYTSAIVSAKDGMKRGRDHIQKVDLRLRTFCETPPFLSNGKAVMPTPAWIDWLRSLQTSKHLAVSAKDIRLSREHWLVTLLVKAVKTPSGLSRLTAIVNDLETLIYSDRRPPCASIRCEFSKSVNHLIDLAEARPSADLGKGVNRDGRMHLQQSLRAKVLAEEKVVKEKQLCTDNTFRLALIRVLARRGPLESHYVVDSPDVPVQDHDADVRDTSKDGKHYTRILMRLLTEWAPQVEPDHKPEFWVYAIFHFFGVPWSTALNLSTVARAAGLTELASRLSLASHRRQPATKCSCGKSCV
jgi:hypothetical protein